MYIYYQIKIGIGHSITKVSDVPTISTPSSITADKKNHWYSFLMSPCEKLWLGIKLTDDECNITSYIINNSR